MSSDYPYLELDQEMTLRGKVNFWKERAGKWRIKYFEVAKEKEKFRKSASWYKNKLKTQSEKGEGE